jgi:citrate lyase gamma subunit
VTEKNSCGQDSLTVKISVATPCIPPTITVYVNESTGSSFTHQLTGKITNINKSDNITITADGVTDKNFRFVPESGQITSSYKFTPGIHNIIIKVTNECGQASETIQVNVNEPCDLPVIKLTVSSSYNASYTHILAGRITNVNNNEGVTVTVDGEIDRTFRFNPADGQISANYKFGPGSHTIVIIAKNDCGEASKTETVEIAAPCNLPVVKFQMSDIDHPQFTHEMTGSVTNVNNKSDITVTVDGVVDNSFQFVPSTKVLSGKFKLSAGKHTITVKAKNSCGEDTESIVVTVAAPCDPPVINFKMSEITHQQFTHEMTGTITNVKNKSDITVTVDGVVDNSFQFVPSTMVLSGKFKLSAGKHTIVVTAKNECGNDTETVTVNVAAPCDLPVINFKMSEITHQQFTHEMTGTITNVKNKSDITVTVDGVVDNSFQFVPSTMVLSGKFKLSAGKHTIVVTAKNECGNDTETVTVNVAAPCDLPVINFKMSEITHQQFTHEMTGTITNVKNKSDITVTVDGVVDNSFQFVPSTMVLSGKFKLSAGKHTIVVTAKNECGNDTETVTVNVAAPCDLPVINFKMSEITHQQFTHEMTGTITNVKNKSDITVTVDGVVDNSFQFVPSTMVLSGKFKLSAGKHTIVVTAKNECGNDTETVTVNVAAPCDLPVINFKMSEITHQQFTHEMTGTITNVKNKSDITVTVDGVVDNSFQFVPSTMVLSGKFKLSAGKHTIVVTAKNECGNDTETVTVNVAAPCDLPVINFKMSEITHQQFTHEMTGTITNVKNKSDITVTVDGVVDNSFQFVPSTMVLSGKFKLSAGKHTIVVTAKNECGNDTETVTVNVAAPCDLPVINFKMSEITHQQFTHEMTGTITNVKNKSDITVTVDGVVDNSFQFVPSTMVLSGKFKLSAGKHTIVVTAKNECGNDTETLTVNVTAPCDPPVVIFKMNEISNQQFTHELVGNITNIKSKADITLTIDGAVNNSFQYNPDLKELSGKFKLSSGTHKVIIKAKNECGEDTETVNIIVAEPCNPPVVNFKVSEIAHQTFTHEISGTVTGVKTKTDITVTIDGVTENNFSYVPTTNIINGTIKLAPGTHKIIIKAKNECGEDTETINVTVADPCIPPVVTFTVSQLTENTYTHKLSGKVMNASTKSEITITVNGTPDNSFTFVPSTSQISLSLKLNPGKHTVVVKAKNDCGEDIETQTITVEDPCIPPVVSFTVSEITETGYTHKYTGTVTNVSSKNEITIKVDGVSTTNFTFNASTGAISGKLNLKAGTHTIVITAKNDCGEDSKSKQVIVKEPEACGPRIEPGNADWQFCLITPSGTYNRSNLTSSFSYDGKASSLFFKATAGGGNAIVGGNSYEITPGKYYLFTGNLNVKVSTSNPGSMGHWSVCIEADKAPTSGTGNSRPTSPCEPVDDGNNNNGNNGDKGGSTTPDKQGGGTNVSPNRQGGASTTTKPEIRNQ